MHAATKARDDSHFAATSKAHARLKQRTAQVGLSTSDKLRQSVGAPEMSPELKRQLSQASPLRQDSASFNAGSFTTGEPSASKAEFKEMQQQITKLQRAMQSQTTIMTKLEGQQMSLMNHLLPGKKTMPSVQQYEV